MPQTDGITKKKPLMRLWCNEPTDNIRRLLHNYENTKKSCNRNKSNLIAGFITFHLGLLYIIVVEFLTIQERTLYIFQFQCIFNLIV